MPSLADLLKVAIPVGAQVTGGVLNNRATNNAVGALTAGGNQAMNTINTAAGTTRQTLADTFAQQRAALQPFEQAGTRTLADLSAGVQPGGGLADPFSYDMNQFWNDPQIQRRIAEGNKLLARKQASGGSLSSGAALKLARDYNDYQIGNEFGKERSAQEEIFRENQRTKYNALMGITNLGANATNEEVRAGGVYGSNLADLDTKTAATIADLQTSLASAQAAGDIQKANGITDTINGILGTISNAQTAKSLAGLATKTAPAIAGAAAPALAGTAAALAPGALGFAAPAGLASIGAAGGGALAGTGALAAPGIAAPALAPGAGAAAGSGGIASGIMPLLTNPWTIAVAAGIIGITSWIRSQAHHEASSWTSGFQNPFDQKMDQINRQFISAAQSGQMTKDQALAARQSAEEAIAQYKAKLAEFASKGSDERKVATQAQRTADEQYGPNFSRWLGQWDSLIAGLA